MLSNVSANDEVTKQFSTTRSRDAAKMGGNTPEETVKPAKSRPSKDLDYSITDLP